MSLVVDAHQHFWTYGTYQTSWMEAPPYAGDSAFQPLRRSFEPDDLAPELQAAGVRYTVAIEAADELGENEALLSNARSHEWIAGVVGWVPLAHPAEVEQALDACADEPAFVGVRHLVNVEPDPDWVMRPEVLQGLQILATRGLTFDYVGILPRHLEHVPVFARRVPDLRIVIDHLGKPPIAAGELEPWSSLLARAAQMPNVFANVSARSGRARGTRRLHPRVLAEVESASRVLNRPAARRDARSCSRRSKRCWRRRRSSWTCAVLSCARSALKHPQPSVPHPALDAQSAR